MKKKTIWRCILLSGVMAAALSGCGGSSQETSAAAESTTSETTVSETTGSETDVDSVYKPGTYEASAKGMGGDVTVKVVVSGDAIESVTVTGHNETAGISDPAIEKIPARIVEAQGLKIDAVSGATVTSNAILTAAADALAQAGADVEVLKEIGLAKEVKEDEKLEADVVVVGGGLAGLSASVSAAESGADVILVEKMASLGGASITCGGELLAAGTDMQKEQGIQDSSQALAEYWIGKGEGHVDEEMLRTIADASPETLHWLKDRGVEFGGVTFSYNYPSQEPLRNHKTADEKGTGFILPMTEAAEKAGVEILLETPAVELIQEDGRVKGVICENEGRKVEIAAKSVILATGGFANNQELVEEYCPAFGTYGTFLGEAHQGDGLIMARDAGANIIAGGGAIVNPMDMGATGLQDPGGVFLNVTPEGKRFADEAAYWFSRSKKLYFDEGYNCYYSILDSEYPLEGLEEAVKAGTAFQGDTVEELAGQLEMEPSVLGATIDSYNQICETGNDTEFGKPARGNKGTSDSVLEKDVPFLNEIKTAPFYAVKIGTNGLTGTFGGPEITINGEVVSVDGQVIPGLYAAGEVANGQLLYHEYPCSGSSIQFCATIGRFAGKAAAEAALK